MSVKTVLLSAFGALVLVPTGTAVVGTPAHAAAPARVRAESSECHVAVERWRERRTTFGVNGADIRSGPSDDCRLLGQGWRGEPVTTYCYKVAEDGLRWSKVRYGSLRGWTRSGKLVEGSTTPCLRKPRGSDSDEDRPAAGNRRDDGRRGGRDQGRRGGRGQ